ncbi:hypothetical protein [Nocardia donostiensis]|uniref:Uncharacterized protein n=1 Tax=Nocardia donostiensis TaxID=1538463 RepID=A0A1V2TIX9_9NOCA|nr:hypothetical protein [Nocardia donostiensis]ONM49454.1 hypothetical protein B0T46_06145 [Nocardia donostiensis]OQS13567.1 hypothetical protein B0T36_19430 [Nocardia donostiensis]OQS19931.1 hypothetical protein B0T44_11820 [Nocardia donostiensis]
MNVEKLRTADDWAAYYRHEFGLPVAERGGFVMLPITSRVCILHLPTVRAEKVRAAVAQQGSENVRVPMLARQIRWSFLAYPDSRPEAEVLQTLNRLDIGLPGVGSAVMLPTGLGRWTREGCYWVAPPERGEPLPPLSAIVDTALTAGGEDLH